MQGSLYVEEMKLIIVIAIVSLALVTVIGVTIIMIILKANKKGSEKHAEEIELLNTKNKLVQHLFDKTRELSRHQRLETMGVVASSMNHEISNMLTPIMGYSLLAIEKVPEGNDELMDDLEHIYQSAYQAKDLVTQFLKMARKSSDHDYSFFSPDSLMETVESLLQPTCPENVKITRDYNCPEECLYANETQIAQVVMNIVINAFQALTATGGNVHISTRLVDENVEIKVTDNGPGISEEDMKHIREPFFTSKTTDEGTGLGLAIVEQILDIYHGTLGIESKVGKGSSFTILIPRASKK